MVSCGFFNSSNGDRKYSSEDISRIISYLVTDGVLETYGQKFFTTPSTSSLGVVLGTGWAWFNNTWTQSDTPILFPLSQPDLSLDRIDTVYLKVDARVLGRINGFGVLEGLAGLNPQPGTFPETTDVYYHPLAYVRVRAEATRIAASDIEILVGKTNAPFITSILQTTDITTLFQGWSEQFGTQMTQWQSGYDDKIDEWESEVDALKDDLTESVEALETQLTTTVNTAVSNANTQLANQQTQFNTNMTVWQSTFTGSLNSWEADFNEWFEHLQTYLSEDVVTNLQLQIDQLGTNKVNVSDKATTDEAQAGTVDTKWMTPLKTEQHLANKKATTAEAQAGTSTNKITTPKNLSEYFLMRKYSGTGSAPDNWISPDQILAKFGSSSSATLLWPFMNGRYACNHYHGFGMCQRGIETYEVGDTGVCFSRFRDNDMVIFVLHRMSSTKYYCYIVRNSFNNTTGNIQSKKIIISSSNKYVMLGSVQSSISQFYLNISSSNTTMNSTTYIVGLQGDYSATIIAASISNTTVNAAIKNWHNRGLSTSSYSHRFEIIRDTFTDNAMYWYYVYSVSADATKAYLGVVKIIFTPLEAEISTATNITTKNYTVTLTNGARGDVLPFLGGTTSLGYILIGFRYATTGFNRIRVAYSTNSDTFSVYDQDIGYLQCNAYLSSIEGMEIKHTTIYIYGKNKNTSDMYSPVWISSGYAINTQGLPLGNTANYGYSPDNDSQSGETTAYMTIKEVYSFIQCDLLFVSSYADHCLARKDGNHNMGKIFDVSRLCNITTLASSYAHLLPTTSNPIPVLLMGGLIRTLSSSAYYMANVNVDSESDIINPVLTFPPFTTNGYYFMSVFSGYDLIIYKLPQLTTISPAPIYILAGRL